MGLELMIDYGGNRPSVLGMGFMQRDVAHLHQILKSNPELAPLFPATDFQATLFRSARFGFLIVADL